MEIKPLNRRQAETFLKVMLAKNMSPQDIAEVLTHLGAMFVEHSKDVVEAAGE